MERRDFLKLFLPTLFPMGLALTTGCRGRQVAHILRPEDKNMVGSHAAGAETWEPLIQTAVGELLGRQHSQVQMTSLSTEGKKKVCFVGVENKSAEDIGDARDQIYQKIDSCLSEADAFELVNKRYVEAGLRRCGLRPDDLFLPDGQRNFTAVMEKMEQPVDYLLWAVVTSQTTKNNQSTQRDYLMTLELVNLSNGETDKESAELRKGYHKSKLGKLRNYGAG